MSVHLDLHHGFLLSMASPSASSSPAASPRSHSHSAYMTRQDDGALSGFETECESQRVPTPSYSNSHSNCRSYGSSSAKRSSTPASASAQRIGERRTCASSSPTTQREPSPGLHMVIDNGLRLSQRGRITTRIGIATLLMPMLNIRRVMIFLLIQILVGDKHNAGGAESLLGAGVRPIGEDLRAAGVGMRNGNRTTDDLFGQANDPQVPLRRARTTVSSTNRTVE
ncbi:hypothetical protein K503DRAFT_801705 [Rhizopogon vinicolor AM-OR11-026]|uniref:Uncharacterized protein n=1 Tax=Rhizopogon vinicolor AM-OR11-026 TaxID=1314800 RepID=A0A1B7MW63_9AGAM|nr:hypothetical protein K503DRAFT_801705 [Rhizopogon vinicolor AM-OR11-026]